MPAKLAGPDQPEERKVLWSEFGDNEVCRRFELPDPIDIEKVSATLDQGMLHVTAGKGPRPEPKAIAIQSA